MTLIAERVFNPGLSQLSPVSLSQRGARTGLCTSQCPGASVPALFHALQVGVWPFQIAGPAAAGSLPPLPCPAFARSDGALWLIGGKCGSHVWLSSSLQVAARCDLLVAGIIPPARRALSSSDSWSQLTPAPSWEEAEPGKLRLL